MPSESLHDTSSPQDDVSPAENVECESDAEAQAKLPVELSQFSQRLASFGLGEAPDPLLTESRSPSKRRPRR